MDSSTFFYSEVFPEAPLSAFVDSFWTVKNTASSALETVGLPDGRIDLLFSKSDKEPYNAVLIGINATYEQAQIEPGALMCTISFKPLGIEYILREPIAAIANSAKRLPSTFWDFREDDLENFASFCEKATHKIQSLLPKLIDSRKLKLFRLVEESHGSISVNELANQVGWSARQINRYFNQHFGIPVKTYCDIIRFRTSLNHIVRGQLFPEENFFDQAHFIKQIKKFSGTVPKDLFKNQNDRFILLSAIAAK